MANVSYDNDRISCILDFGSDSDGNPLTKRYSVSNVSRDATDDNVLSFAGILNSITNGQGVTDVLRRKTSIITQ